MAKSNLFSVTVLPQSQLATACAALASGANAAFSAGAQSSFSDADLAWQTNFHHDTVNGRVHLMGKPANNDTAWKHQIYTVATGTWAADTRGISSWNAFGHIYGNFGMDYDTGEVYQARGALNSQRKVARWTNAAGWALVPSGDLYPGALADIPNGVAYHPNLYGPGDGGACIETQFRVCFWRKSTSAVANIAHGEDAYGNKEGIGVYWAAQDAVYLGCGPLLRITPNSTPGGTPVATAMPDTPIEVGGHSHEGGGTFGSLHVHPGNPNKLLLVSTTTQAAYTSTNGSTWTQIGNHPFTLMPRVVCSLRGGLGCLWAIGRSGGTHYSQLWKPAP